MSKTKPASTETNVAAYNSVSVATLQQAINMAIDTDTVLYIGGPPGVGKSEIIEGVAHTKGYAVLDRRVSYMVPDDFFGIPRLAHDSDETVQCKPSIIRDVEQMKASTGKPVLLTCDELTSASSPGVYAALYQLFLNRCLAGYCLPPDTRIIAAGNRSEDKGVVSDMPMPLANRMQHVVYPGPTWGEWETWAAKNSVHPHVLAFLAQQPQYLCGKIAEGIENSADGRFPSPRSWAFLSRQLHYADAVGLDHGGRLRTAASWLGDETALRFEVVMRLAEKLPSFESVLKSPDKTPVFPDDLAASYIMMSGLIQKVTKQDQFDKVFVYVERMPKELLGIFFRLALRSPKVSTFILARRELITKYAEFASAALK